MKLSIINGAESYDINLMPVTQLCGKDISKKRFIINSLSKHFSSSRYKDYEADMEDNILIDGNVAGREYFDVETVRGRDDIEDEFRISRTSLVKQRLDNIINRLYCQREIENIRECLVRIYDELEKDILAYNPTIILPHSIDNNDAVASRRFSSDNHLIICISRQFGTGGHTIGFELAQRLGIAYYDKEIIHLACDRMGLNSKDVTDYGIDSSGSSRGILSSIGKASKKFFSTQSDMLFFTQSNLICEMATQESCIFMGRCADVVLTNNNIPHLSIFLSAPFKERVKYEMGIASCDYKTASAKVKTMDQERKNYYQYYTGRQWGYAGNYDLCVNTFFYGHDETIQVLYDMAEMSCKK